MSLSDEEKKVLELWLDKPAAGISDFEFCTVYEFVFAKISSKLDAAGTLWEMAQRSYPSFKLFKTNLLAFDAYFKVFMEKFVEDGRNKLGISIPHLSKIRRLVAIAHIMESLGEILVEEDRATIRQVNIVFADPERVINFMWNEMATSNLFYCQFIWYIGGFAVKSSDGAITYPGLPDQLKL